MTQNNQIEIQATDGSGTFNAFVAKPQTDGPAPGLIVIQEIFGINQVMRDLCYKYARQGYIAICPDLFWRIEPGIELTDKTSDEWDRAFELFGLFDADKGVEDLQATLNTLRSLEDCTGRAGNVGFCLGGKMSYLMSTRTDTDASVSYYGVGIQDMLDEADHIKKPLMLHIAEGDEFVPKDAQQQIKDELLGHAHVTIHSYPGVDHAFARVDGQHYNDTAAQLANDRTADFLEEYLKSSPADNEPQASYV